jgi:hypothetical protein
VFFVAIDKFYNLNASLRGKKLLAKMLRHENSQLFFVLLYRLGTPSMGSI